MSGFFNDILLWIEQLFQNFKDDVYLNFIQGNRYMLMVKGLGVTLQLTFFALILGIIIGVIAALFKLSNSRLLNKLASLYVDVIRGTPAVVQLLILYYIVLRNVNSRILVGVIAFGINSGAYIAEIIRAGILAVDKGQTEAGRSLGFSYSATMRYIVFPQAIKNILPALVNEFIILLKETAIVGYIALEDLTKAGDLIRSLTYDPYMPLLAVAIVYLILTTTLSKALGLLERRLRQSDNR